MGEEHELGRGETKRMYDATIEVRVSMCECRVDRWAIGASARDARDVMLCAHTYRARHDLYLRLLSDARPHADPGVRCCPLWCDARVRRLTDRTRRCSGCWWPSLHVRGS